MLRQQASIHVIRCRDTFGWRAHFLSKAARLLLAFVLQSLLVPPICWLRFIQRATQFKCVGESRILFTSAIHACTYLTMHARRMTRCHAIFCRCFVNTCNSATNWTAQFGLDECDSSDTKQLASKINLIHTRLSHAIVALSNISVQGG